EVADVGEPPAPCPRLRLLKEQIDLRTIEISGKSFVELGRADTSRRVCRDLLVAVQETIEAPNSRQHPRHGTLREAAPEQMAHEGANRETVDAFPCPGLRSVVARQERNQRVQIAAVRRYGVRRIVSLFLEVLEKVGDLVRERELRRRFAHGTNACAFVSVRQVSIAAIARSASSSRLRRLSRMCSSSSSSSAKLAFIG